MLTWDQNRARTPGVRSLCMANLHFAMRRPATAPTVAGFFYAVSGQCTSSGVDGCHSNVEQVTRPGARTSPPRSGRGVTRSRPRPSPTASSARPRRRRSEEASSATEAAVPAQEGRGGGGPREGAGEEESPALVEEVGEEVDKPGRNA